MPEEIIDSIKIKGHAKIQLFDATTNVLENEIEQDNFIGVAGRRFFLACAISALKGYILDNDSTRVEGMSTPDPFNCLKLTDNVSAVDPSALVIPGNKIGYAIQKAYVGSDTQRGTLNVNESLTTPSSIKLVFDFPTTVANGVIGTVGFDNSYYGGCSGILVGVTGYNYPGITGDHLGNIYFSVSGKLCVYNVATGVKTTKPTSITGGILSGCYYNNKIYFNYYAGSSVPVYVYDLSNDTCVVVKSSVQYIGSYCLTCDGTYFYTTDSNYVYRYDLNFNLISQKYVAFSTAIGTYYGITIMNAGWFMFGNGKELLISDLFATTSVVTVRSITSLPLNTQNMQPVYEGGLWAFSYQTAFVPSIFYGGGGGYTSGGGYDVASGLGSLGYSAVIADGNTIGSCIVLGTPLTKVNTQTMKITYTFSLSY